MPQLFTFSVIQSLNDIHSCEPITVGGVAGGTDIKAVEEGSFCGIPNVVFCPQTIANLLSFSILRDNHISEYLFDEDVFVLTLADNTQYRFERFGRLYVWNSSGHLFITTVQGNMIGYTRNEIR